MTSPTFIAPIACAAVLRTNQTWLNSLWTYMAADLASEYYSGSLRLLTMIQVSQTYWVRPDLPTTITTGGALTPYFYTNYTYGTDFVYKVTVGDGEVNTWLGGVLKHTTPVPTDTGFNYFTAGVYNQFGVASAGATEYTEVEIRNFTYAETSVGAFSDLIVTDITWSPSSPVPGNAVTFSANVTNEGSVAPPDGVAIGVGFSVDGAPVSFSPDPPLK